MGYYMSKLYRRYFRATGFSELDEEIENIRQEVRDYLNQAQRADADASDRCARAVESGVGPGQF